MGGTFHEGHPQLHRSSVLPQIAGVFVGLFQKDNVT